jgi:hypothetical protein
VNSKKGEAVPGVLRKIVIAGMLVCGIGTGLLASAGVQRSSNEDNGLEKWHFIEGDIEIELVQRLPDQTRALLMQHAFSREVIEDLATSCMFQTIIRNSGKSGTGQPVAIDLTAWRMRHAGKESGIQLKEPLIASWSDEAASPEAKLVIRWGMFPTRQEFLPGDYNWGLTAYGIPPGSQFDLDVTWTEGGKPHSGEIRDIVCAPDVDRLK